MDQEEDLIVEVLDRTLTVLFKGTDAKAVEWICANPVHPYLVYLEGLKDLMSIDDYLREWDELEYP